MADSLPRHTPAAHHVLPDIGRPVMAKATVRIPDVDWMRKLGAVIQEAVDDAKWSNKEAAGKVGVDDAEFGKWINGSRRPHFNRLFAVEEVRRPLIIALAELGGDGVEIDTHIRIRRTA